MVVMVLVIFIVLEKFYVVDLIINFLLYVGLDKENLMVVEFLDINGSVSCSIMVVVGFIGLVFWF